VTEYCDIIGAKRRVIETEGPASMKLLYRIAMGVKRLNPSTYVYDRDRNAFVLTLPEPLPPDPGNFVREIWEDDEGKLFAKDVYL
jgi:hypothetical protein